MTGFEDLDVESSTVSMFDEEGNEAKYTILVTKKDEDYLYMLAEADVPLLDDQTTEVLIFKCVEDEDPNDMVFELVEEDHESFERAFSLFKEDFDTLGIEY